VNPPGNTSHVLQLPQSGLHAAQGIYQASLVGLSTGEGPAISQLAYLLHLHVPALSYSQDKLFMEILDQFLEICFFSWGQ
jgi:hypothetical protein